MFGDDDEEGNTGTGALAAYQFGKWAAESSARDKKLYQSLTGQSPVARADYNHVMQINAQLAAENRRLVDQLNRVADDLHAYKFNYEVLHKWATETGKKLTAANAELRSKR